MCSDASAYHITFQHFQISASSYYNHDNADDILTHKCQRTTPTTTTEQDETMTTTTTSTTTMTTPSMDDTLSTTKTHAQRAQSSERRQGIIFSQITPLHVQESSQPHTMPPPKTTPPLYHKHTRARNLFISPVVVVVVVQPMVC